jgi:hypothetical protein
MVKKKTGTRKFAKKKNIKKDPHLENVKANVLSKYNNYAGSEIIKVLPPKP